VHRSSKLLVLTLASASVLVAGCSSSSSSKASSTPTPIPASSVPASAAETPTPSASPSDQALTVLVTNDDGVHAEGINTIVVALQKEPGLTIKVVGPATNQSGTGGKTSPTTPTYSNTTTTSGYPAVAVNGTPSDSANVAFDKLNLKPDLAISGINAGQNLGPVVDISGTVGAARVAARHGVPALAVSSGIATKIDYAAAAKLAIDWLREERASLPATPSTSSPATVTGLNVPTCTTGSVRGELKVTLQAKAGPGESVLGASNCASTATPTTELAAFADGFATIMTIPLNPSS
jgi:5'-nucleotidase